MDTLFIIGLSIAVFGLVVLYLPSILSLIERFFSKLTK